MWRRLLQSRRHAASLVASSIYAYAADAASEAAAVFGRYTNGSVQPLHSVEPAATSSPVRQTLVETLFSEFGALRTSLMSRYGDVTARPTVM